MRQLDEKLLSLWEWEGGAIRTDISCQHELRSGAGSNSADRVGDKAMWYLIVEHPPRVYRLGNATPKAAPKEVFLDFDPVLPGWPPAEYAGASVQWSGDSANSDILAIRTISCLSQQPQKGADVPKPQRFAIVITQDGKDRRFVEMPWLETNYQIDASDWIVLSNDGWRAVAEGDLTIWNALERKLLVGFHVSHPQLIAIIGHPSGRKGSYANDSGEEEVWRIVRRIRSLLLPATVLGFWTDEGGSLLEILQPSECAKRKRFEFA